MSEINVCGLTFGYPGSFDNIFENVSFKLDAGWRVGFIGRNGRGKTTFLRLLMGGLEYTGKITSGLAFDYFPFEVQNPERDTLEIIEQVSGAEFWEICREISLLGVEQQVLYRAFSTLSGGEQAKVLLAGLFLKQNNFLLIDEPTNHLDAPARKRVAEYLQGKGGFVLVSHDRDFLDGCIDHVLSINKADIQVQRGNFSTWWENKARCEAFEQSENQRLERDIKTLTTAARQTANWADNVEKSKKRQEGMAVDRGYIGHKAAKLMKRSKNAQTRIDKAIEQKQGLLKNLENAEALKMFGQKFHAKRLVYARDLTINYGGRQVCGPVSFEINQGDRIAITGANGSGKSSLLKLILGRDIPHGGLFEVAGLSVSYVSQDTHGLSGGLYDFAAQQGIDQSLFITVLRKLGFERAQLEKDISEFSAGQKKKTLLAKSLCQQAHLFVWDEPLNYIDLLSRIQIEQVILEYTPTMVFVEHDRAFVEKVATWQLTIDS